MSTGQFQQVTLYRKDSNGGIREWSISATDFNIEMAYGVVGGEIQENNEYISEGKAGRTRHEQMLSRINSLLKKKLDRGYLYSIEEARNSNNENRIGLPKPMLAKKFYGCEEDIDYGNITVQHKYNGFRCLVTKQDGVFVAYSRNGKLFQTITHIFDDLLIGEGEVLDGELYCHGESLQTISSWAKKFQPDTKKLNYHVYDYVMDADYSERVFWVKHSIKHGSDCVEFVKSVDVDSRDALMHALKQAIADGYEGLMIRNNSMPYESGKRSKGLLKLKSFDGKKYLHDDEFLVIGINESSDGWAVLICSTVGGKTFRVTAPGKVEDKLHVYRNMDSYIGRYVQVGYSEITPDGKPFHPVAIQWRNKYAE